MEIVKRLGIQRLSADQQERMYEKNSGISIVEQRTGTTVQEQLARFFRVNPHISEEQLSDKIFRGYDDQAILEHYNKTGEMPIGRWINEDYFEVYDKNKLLLERYKIAQEKMAKGEGFKQSEEGYKPSEQQDAVTYAINNERNNSVADNLPLTVEGKGE